mmetsp:Transcript_15586/g.38884  ORF Transcript_15586/g.38884 Transcript_15586/m.38884 type:complete len:252 (-) Transcript_15586:1073-1828(-)
MYVFELDEKYSVLRRGRTNVSTSDLTASDSAKAGDDCTKVYNDRAPSSVCSVRPKASNRSSKLNDDASPTIEECRRRSADPKSGIVKDALLSTLKFGKSGMSDVISPSQRLSVREYSSARNGFCFLVFFFLTFSLLCRSLILLVVGSSQFRLLFDRRRSKLQLRSARTESVSHNTSLVRLDSGADENFFIIASCEICFPVFLPPLLCFKTPITKLINRNGNKKMEPLIVSTPFVASRIKLPPDDGRRRADD